MGEGVLGSGEETGGSLWEQKQAGFRGGFGGGGGDIMVIIIDVVFFCIVFHSSFLVCEWGGKVETSEEVLHLRVGGDRDRDRGGLVNLTN